MFLLHGILNYSLPWWCICEDGRKLSAFCWYNAEVWLKAKLSFLTSGQKTQNWRALGKWPVPRNSHLFRVSSASHSIQLFLSPWTHETSVGFLTVGEAMGTSQAGGMNLNCCHLTESNKLLSSASAMHLGNTSVQVPELSQRVLLYFCI